MPNKCAPHRSFTLLINVQTVDGTLEETDEDGWSKRRFFG
jgi:hypothetical protein